MRYLLLLATLLLTSTKPSLAFDQIFTEEANVPACYITQEMSLAQAQRQIQLAMIKKCEQLDATPFVDQKNISSQSACGGTKITTKFRCLSESTFQVFLESYLYIGSPEMSFGALHSQLKQEVKQKCGDLKVSILSLDISYSVDDRFGQEDIDLEKVNVTKVLHNYPRAFLRATIRCTTK